jgi:hypothetical protein
MITTLKRELVEFGMGFTMGVGAGWSSQFARPSRRAASSSKQDGRVFPSEGRLILLDGV